MAEFGETDSASFSFGTSRGQDLKGRLKKENGLQLVLSFLKHGTRISSHMVGRKTQRNACPKHSGRYLTLKGNEQDKAHM